MSTNALPTISPRIPPCSWERSPRSETSSWIAAGLMNIYEDDESDNVSIEHNLPESYVYWEDLCNETI